jgi:hypothetical protein
MLGEHHPLALIVLQLAGRLALLPMVEQAALVLVVI